MRRLIRRAVRYAFDLGLQQNFFAQIVPTVSGLYTEDYPEVAERAESVVAVLVKEEKAFRRTLNKGIKQLRGYRAGVGGEELFVLYDTFGFPVELSTEEARRQGIPLNDGWQTGFEDKMAEQRARSQAATRMKVG
jgi:alanyl-tRNA synthetase